VPSGSDRREDAGKGRYGFVRHAAGKKCDTNRGAAKRGGSGLSAGRSERKYPLCLTQRRKVAPMKAREEWMGNTDTLTRGQRGEGGGQPIPVRSPPYRIHRKNRGQLLCHPGRKEGTGRGGPGHSEKPRNKQSPRTSTQPRAIKRPGQEARAKTFRTGGEKKRPARGNVRLGRGGETNSRRLERAGSRGTGGRAGGNTTGGDSGRTRGA